MKRGFNKSTIRIWILFFALIVFALLSPYDVSASESTDEANLPKHIYIVYDNSGSMDDTNAAMEAAYGLELIASMMDEQDVLTVYFMSDSIKNGVFCYKEIYSLSGEGSSNVLSKLHDELVNLEYTGQTYSDGIIEALEEIENTNLETEVPFLIVLSDGKFNAYAKDGEMIKGSNLPTLSNYTVKSVYAALGDNAEIGALDATEQLDTKDKDSDSVVEVFKEIGNLIYDRQEVTSEKSKGRVTVTLDLPAERIILLAQSDSEEVTSEQITAESEGLALQSGSSVSSIHIGESVGNIYGVVNTYSSDTDDLIPAGTYEFALSSEADVTVYVEYEVEYAIRLYDDEKSWVLGGESSGGVFREGTYQIEIRLMDVQTGELLDISSSLYHGMEVEWSLDGENIESGQSIEWELKEGNHTIMCDVCLEGNFKQEVSGECTIRHKLGTTSLKTDYLEDGFDIDKLETGMEAISVSLLEDGGNVSHVYELECVVESESEESPYTYVCSESADGWEIVPSYDQDSALDPVGTYDMTVYVTGNADGEEIDEKKIIQVNYYAMIKEIELQDITITRDNPFPIWDTQARKQITAETAILIDGEPISESEWITDYQVTVEDTENSRITAQIFFSEAGEAYLAVEENLGVVEMLNFLSMPDSSDTVTVSVIRYGEECAGVCEVNVVVNQLGVLGIAQYVLIVLAMCLFVILIIWMVFCLLFNVICFRHKINLVFYGHNGRKVAERKVRKLHLKNLFVPGSIRATARIKGWKGVTVSETAPKELELTIRSGGKCRIKNIRDVIDSGCFTNNGRMLTHMESEFRLKDGLELDVESRVNSTDRIKMRIYTER